MIRERGDEDERPAVIGLDFAVLGKASREGKSSEGASPGAPLGNAGGCPTKPRQTAPPANCPGIFSEFSAGGGFLGEVSGREGSSLASWRLDAGGLNIEFKLIGSPCTYFALSFISQRAKVLFSGSWQMTK
jgi:hypothetical protein